MARLIVLVRPSRRVELDEAEAWLRRELAPVVGAARAGSVALSRLASASVPWSQDWGWLIEIEFESAELAGRAVRESAWAMLLGDLRLLGMHPMVAVVDSAEQLTD